MKPTANLDVGTEAIIQDALERLLENRTAIIIAHRLSTIRNVDRILVLKKWRAGRARQSPGTAGPKRSIFQPLPAADAGALKPCFKSRSKVLPRFY